MGMTLPSASPPKLTPMMAAVMSPRTRKRIEAIETEGGEMAVVARERIANSGEKAPCFDVASGWEPGWASGWG